MVYLRTKWHHDPSSRLATTDMAKNWVGVVCRFSGGSWVPIGYKVAWVEAYLRTKWHLSPFSHLATMDIGQQLGTQLPIPLWEGELGPHLTQCRVNRGLPLYKVALAS